MQFDQMIDQAQEYLDDPNADVWTDARIGRLLNIAQDYVVSVIEQEDEDYFIKSENVSVTAVTDNSDFTNALASDYRKSVVFHRLVTNQRPAKLFYVPWRDFDKTDLDIPTEYDPAPLVTLRGANLVVRAPSEAFTLRHWYLPVLAAMTGTATSSIPREYHAFVVAHAVHEALLSENNDANLIAYWKKKVDDYEKNCKETVGARQVQQAWTVQEV